MVRTHKHASQLIIECDWTVPEAWGGNARTSSFFGEEAQASRPPYGACESAARGARDCLHPRTVRVQELRRLRLR